ncbi:MAG: SIS domain-containing protein [Anaerolineae bacterium]|nr:SIS domain-containing protein [Anaerolineae bacterium]
MNMKTEISPYILDILEQPAALERCLIALNERPTLETFRIRLESGRYRRIILTGMGASFFAAIPLQYRLLRQGYDVHLLETSELIHNLPELVVSESLFVVISQSGQSAEIIQLLERAERHVPVIAITNGETSPLALHSHAVILIHAGIENTVSCKTYLNTLAALAAVGDDLVGRSPLLPDLLAAPQAVQDYLDAWTEHVAFFFQEMATADQLFLLGRGDSLAAAQTGGLILKEAARFPAQAMSVAAYRHGPIELTSPSVHVLVFAGAPALHAINGRLVQDILGFGGMACLIRSGGRTTGALTLPEVPLPALPILEMLPPQMLSIALADRSGREAGVFRFASKVTAVQ